MSIQIIRLPNGKLRQNCYLVGNDQGECLIIDPGSDASNICSVIDDNQWTPLSILNTHAHYDHIGAAAPLMEKFNIPFYLDRLDARILRSANIYKTLFDSAENIQIPEITFDLGEMPEEFEIGGICIFTFASPGHTPGGRCFHIEGNLFTGDTLMRNNIGRTDLYGGNDDALAESLKTIMRLPGETVFHSGHGQPSTLAEQSRTNRKLRAVLDLAGEANKSEAGAKS
jgi:hydroxyacylglutathione hydrolase